MVGEPIRDAPVLVAVDFSKDSEAAFEYAVDVSQRLAAPLLLVHAFDPQGWIPEAEGEGGHAEASFLQGRRCAATQRIEEYAARARDTSLRAEARVIDGPPAKRVTELARSAQARMIVVGQRGESRPLHVPLGSTAQRVVQTADRPILVVPENPAKAVTDKWRLLVGIDYSAGAREALREAIRMVRRHGGGELLVAHGVREEGPARLPRESMTPPSNLEMRLERERLEEWSKTEIPTGVAYATRAVHGNADDVLIDRAREERCEWIVVGVQGLSAWAPFMMGETTERVLQASERPVLTVWSNEPPSLDPPD